VELPGDRFFVIIVIIILADAVIFLKIL